MAARTTKSRSINLLPIGEFEASTTGRVLHWMLTTFRVIVITVELVVISGFLSRFWLDLQNSDLGDEIIQKEALIKSYSSFEQEFRQIQKRLEVYSFVSAANRNLSPALDTITPQLPADVQIISIEKNASKVTINAASLSEQSISQFVNQLTNQKILKDVTVGLVESSVESAFIIFTVQAKL